MRNILLLSILLMSNVYAHNMDTASSDEFSIPETGSSMFHLPIQVGFDGSLTFGYSMDMDTMNHSDMNHGDMNQGDMNQGDMNHGDMNQGDMNQSDMNQGDMNQGDMNQGDMNQGDMNQGDMNHDEMDHDDMNHDEMDQETDSNESQNSSHDHSGIHWHVMPMISLGLDKINRTIKIDHETVKTIKAQRIEAGAGLMVMGHIMELPWSTMITAGLMPYKGKYKYMERTSNISNVKKSFLKVPSSINDLNDWNKGDKLSYSTHGGVMAHGGVTFGHLLDLSMNYMFQGKWKVSLQKISETTVKVSLLNDDMHHYSTSVGNMTLSINSGKMNMKGKSETFIFDLSDSEAHLAYINAVSGNIIPAQELSATNRSVFRESFGSSFMTAFQRMTTVQLPSLFLRSKSNTKMYSLSNTTDNYFGMKTETNIAMTVKTKSTSGLLSKHKKRNEYFMAMAMNVTQNGSKHVNYAGSWQRLFERDKVTANQLNTEVVYLTEKLGLDASKLKLPVNEKLGYFRTQFQINLTQGGTDKLMALPTNTKRVDLIQKSYDLINDSFRNTPEKMKKLCTVSILKNCHNKMIDNISTYIVEMWTALKEMQLAKQHKDWASFSKAYNKFGSFMMENQFTLKTILNELDKSQYKKSFKFVGENHIEQSIQL